MTAKISVDRAPVPALWAAVVAMLAHRFGMDPSSIAAVSGHGSPAKVVAVDGTADGEIGRASPFGWQPNLIEAKTAVRLATAMSH